MSKEITKEIGNITNYIQTLKRRIKGLEVELAELVPFIEETMTQLATVEEKEQVQFLGSRLLDILDRVRGLVMLPKEEKK